MLESLSSPPALVWAGAAVAAAAIAVAVLAFTYSPGPPSLTLTPASLIVHDRFYPVTLSPADVDIGGIRVVDLAQEPGWRPTRRTNGFGNGHYSSGWFRVANGQKVRMYRAGGSQLVLLPPRSGGPTVLLEVENPGAFVQELRQEWPGGLPG